MLQQRYLIRDVRQLLLVGVGLFVAYLAGSLIASGNETRLALLAVASVGGLVLYNPRLGLYAFCFTLVLVPIDWRIEGLKGTSVNAILIGLSTVALGASMLVRRNRLTFSSLYVPAGIAALVTWTNFLLRYGAPFWNVPLILSEALIIFVLSFHLISNQTHLRRLLVSVLLAVTIITMMDVVLTLISIQGGSALGAIRAEQTWIGTASTTQSHFREMLLPLLIASTLLAPNRRIRFLALVALLTTVAWLALAHTRTGFLVLALAPVATLILLPGAQRARFFPLLLIAFPIVLLSATYLTDAWTILMEKNRAELEVGLEGGRASLWVDAFRGFMANPWIGSGLGPSHSYFPGDRQGKWVWCFSCLWR